jgi:hypothetical protein
MMTVSSGQTQTISQGQSDTDDTILSGGTEAVVLEGRGFDDLREPCSRIRKVGGQPTGLHVFSPVQLGRL